MVPLKVVKVSMPISWMHKLFQGLVQSFNDSDVPV